MADRRILRAGSHVLIVSDSRGRGLEQMLSLTEGMVSWRVTVLTGGTDRDCE